MPPESSKLITADQAQFTDEQRRLITDVLVKGGSPTEVQFFFNVAERLNLDPFKRQIHAMKRWDGTLGREVLQFMVSIEGLRSIASRCKTSEGKDAYAGSSKPIFTEKGGQLYSAEVTVYRIVQGEARAFAAEVFYDECVQTKGLYEGHGQNKRKVGEEPNSMWQKRPRGQLGKCAEAAALRKAFPEETGGVYIEEEGPSEHELRKPEAPKPPRPEAEGMEVDTEVLPPDDAPQPRHWSDLLLEDGYKLVKFEHGKWAGKALWEIARDGNFEDAFKDVPQGDSIERLALDAMYFAKLKTRLQKKGYDLDEATAALRKERFLAEDAELTSVPGERLLDLGAAIGELPKIEQ